MNIEENMLLLKNERKVLAGMIGYQDLRYTWSEKLTDEFFIDYDNKEIFNHIIKNKNLPEHDLMLSIDNYAKKINIDAENVIQMWECEKDYCKDDHPISELIRFKNYRDLKKVFFDINPIDPTKEKITALYECLDIYDERKEDIGTFKTAFGGIARMAQGKDEKTRKVKTGFAIYDKLLGGGLSKGYHVIGARPGGCKTTFALQSAMDYAETNKDELVCFVSLEVGQEDLWYKLVSNRADIAFNVLENGLKTRSVVDKFVEKGTIYSAPEKQNFYYIATTETNTIRIEKIVKDLEKKTNKKCGLICIDYLQILSPVKKNTRSKTEEVQQASDDVRRLASKYKVIVLAQVNRTGDSEDCPETKHIKDSSQIEQDASSIVFLWWKDKSLCEINFGIKKNRYGRSDVFLNGTLLGPKGRFRIDHRQIEENNNEDEPF